MDEDLAAQDRQVDRLLARWQIWDVEDEPKVSGHVS